MPVSSSKEICELVQRNPDISSKVRSIGWLELSTQKAIKKGLQTMGGDGNSQLYGYGSLLAVYLQTNANVLPLPVKQKLEMLAVKLYNAGDALTPYALPRNYPNENSNDHGELFLRYSWEKYIELQKDNIILVPSGCQLHSTLATIRKFDDTYIYTLYNAGFGSEYSADNKALVNSTVRHKIKNNDPSSLIGLIYNTAIIVTLDTVGYKKYQYDIRSSYLEGQPIYIDSQPMQHWGNCSSRCIREMLRYELSKSNYLGYQLRDTRVEYFANNLFDNLINFIRFHEENIGQYAISELAKMSAGNLQQANAALK